MKLVLASHSTTIGGAELVLLELVGALVDRGVTVDVVLPGRGVLGERLDAAGARSRARMPAVPTAWARKGLPEPRKRLVKSCCARSYAARMAPTSASE